MLWLIVGLVTFLGIHSVSIFAPAWRDSMVARLGALSSTPKCERYVGESGRMSMITSQIAPRVQRTSFVSTAGSTW